MPKPAMEFETRFDRIDVELRQLAGQFAALPGKVFIVTTFAGMAVIVVGMILLAGT